MVQDHDVVRICLDIVGYDARATFSEALDSKGRYAFDFVCATDRVTQPMLRVAGAWKPVPWDEAISLTADALNDN